jgi:hypothetical protein
MTQATTVAASSAPARAAAPNPRVVTSTTRAVVPTVGASDDEILGIVTPRTNARRSADQLALEFDADTTSSDPEAATDTTTVPIAGNALHIEEPENLRLVFDANPEIRAAWQDARAYREVFATPQAARDATALLADVNRMDALFFSRRPEDHAALARSIADLDPASFESLARAIGEFAQTNGSNVARVFRPDAFPPGANANSATRTSTSTANETSTANGPAVHESRVAAPESRPAVSDAQSEFFHATNASAVEGVVAAIESQVERLLPEGITKSARARVVGEIYRELDTNLRSNRQLASQMRDAFRSGALDADHQHAIVSLITSRARQALPAVAKRVLNEWTSTVVNANQERRTRQRTAERRVDIAGSSGAGNDGHRSMSPRDLDYSRLSDADILNL